MKAFLASFLLLPLAAFSRLPDPVLTVDNADPVVTESWRARIVFHVPPLEGRYAERSPLSTPSTSPFGSFFEEKRTGLALQGFPVADVRFSQAVTRVDVAGVKAWRVELLSEPILAARPGTVEVGPVAVEAALFDGRFTRGFFGAEPHVVNRRFVTPKVTVTVHEPPEKGRPAAYTGAIGSNVTVQAALDANVCTVGDPLIFTLRVSGGTDPSRIRPPSLAAALKREKVFRADISSLKAHTEGATRIFTWRVRALKAGTVEFPSVPLAYFDVRTRTYRTCAAESIPVQVKAGAQVALALADADLDETAFPMPDGLDLDFPEEGTRDFTFRRALSLAGRAVSPADFAAAAAAYGDYLGQDARGALSLAALFGTFSSAERRRLARHCANLGALRTLAGDARGALAAYRRASWFAGDTPSLVRGIRAACARLRNDPRADLPLARIILPFWFGWNLFTRIAVAGLGLLLLALMWYLADRLGRGGGVLAFLAALLLVPEQSAAQGFFRSSFGGSRSHVKASVALVPETTVVDEPSAFVFSFEVEQGVDVDQLRLGGLPEGAGAIVYGELVREADAAASQRGYVVKRVRLPVRFLAPFKAPVAPVVAGMLVTRRGNGTSFSFSSVNFNARCAPLEVEVRPLPAAGRPEGFSGAVGRGFTLTGRLSPVSVHPGDLVTAEYALSFEGYLPTNVFPRVSGLERDFKVYEMKETARREGAVTWRQMLVPQSVAATNRLTLALDCYDVAQRAYRTLETRLPALAFVSDRAASTVNTAVLVDGDAASGATRGEGGFPGAAKAAGIPLVLRLMPAETAAVVATLPGSTPLETRDRRGAWCRVETPQAIGWVKASDILQQPTP